MTNIKVLYGKGTIETEIPDNRLGEVLLPETESFDPKVSEEDLCRNALNNPIQTDKLSELAKDKKKVVILASDHTRPVPSKIMMPLMLEEIRKYNSEADVTILISTGMHRASTEEEMIAKFGEEIVKNEKIEMHDSLRSDLKEIGTLPSGSELYINKKAAEADLLVSEGFIEPHFFAGYSGGRKSVFPGITGGDSVRANHCSEFIASDYARTGILKNNPIHEDMLSAAKQANLAFIFNVVLNSEKEIIKAVAGDVEMAHLEGTNFLAGLAGVTPEITPDIVITSNGGYPMDQNLYQSVKGMTAGEAVCKEKGVVIIAARGEDGHGGEDFLNTFKYEKDLNKIMEKFLSRSKKETEPDQWQSQVFARVLLNNHVVMVTEAPEEMVKDLHMHHANDLAEAIEKADNLLGHDKGLISVIPDGVGVIVLNK